MGSSNRCRYQTASLHPRSFARPRFEHPYRETATHAPFRTTSTMRAFVPPLFCRERAGPMAGVPGSGGRCHLSGSAPAVRVPGSDFPVVRLLQDIAHSSMQPLPAPRRPDSSRVRMKPGATGMYGDHDVVDGGLRRIHTPKWANRWNKHRISSAGIGLMIPMVI